jgi:hypothetical protein
VKNPEPKLSRRRMFQLLGAAVAAAAAKVVLAPDPVRPVRSTWNGKTRWIGHC